MATHVIEPSRRTLHGHWSRDLPPVLAIHSGDTVRFGCLDAMWCSELPGEWPWKRFEPRQSTLDDGHALTGPVLIRGANPGATLEIHVERIIPGTWGWTTTWLSAERAKALAVNESSYFTQRWNIDPDQLIATDIKTHRQVSLKPFMGVMGVAPPDPGVHSTTPPRIWGGNIDCKELIAGATLYLPVAVEGALFSVGDGHAAQGDGEVCGTAIECPVRQVDLTFRVREDIHLTAPRARIAGAWITFGFDQDLNKATIMALNDMLNLIQQHRRVPREEALAIASVAADLRITQIVNQTQGVHCILPDESLT